jgi:pilus assembly protein FimV
MPGGRELPVRPLLALATQSLRQRGVVMLVKRSFRALLLVLLPALPAGAFALGIGDLHLLSPLGAPLQAQVDLVAAPAQINSLQVRIASRETYSRYGLDYPSYLAGVRATAVHTPDGRAVIELKSTEPLHQVYVNLLVEVRWARGHSVREYLVVPEPPIYTPGQTAAATPAAAR